MSGLVQLVVLTIFPVIFCDSLEENPFKFVVKIESLCKRGSVSTGSGFLITKKNILTSATRIHKYSIWLLHYETEEANFAVTTDSATVYPDFDPTTLANNIGIIYAPRIAEDLVQTIALPQPFMNIPLPGYVGTSYGLRPTNNTFFHYEKFSTEGIVLNGTYCGFLLRKNSANNLGFNFCTINSLPSEDVPPYADGSGFTVNVNGTEMLVGLSIANFKLSDSNSCATHLFVSAFVDWISDQINN